MVHWRSLILTRTQRLTEPYNSKGLLILSVSKHLKGILEYKGCKEYASGWSVLPPQGSLAKTTNSDLRKVSQRKRTAIPRQVFMEHRKKTQGSFWLSAHIALLTRLLLENGNSALFSQTWSCFHRHNPSYQTCYNNYCFVNMPQITYVLRLTFISWTYSFSLIIDPFSEVEITRGEETLLSVCLHTNKEQNFNNNQFHHLKASWKPLFNICAETRSWKNKEMKGFPM